jgi:endoglycosylceramidase
MYKSKKLTTTNNKNLLAFFGRSGPMLGEKLRIELASLALLLLCAACGSSSSPQEGDAPAVALPLSHSGRWITDSLGRVVILHGMNMVYKAPPYAPDAGGFGDDDASFLEGEGYNAVRLGVIYEGVESSPGVYNDAYLDRIAGTVDTLGAHGIVSMLDSHQDLYSEEFGGEGFPAWAVQDDGLPSAPQISLTYDYLLELGLNAAFDNFWRNWLASDGVGLQDHHAHAWAHVAGRFKSDPNVLGYELINEPWPGVAYPTCLVPVVGCPMSDTVLTELYKRDIAAIRSVDPSTLVWYEPYLLFNFGFPTSVDSGGDAAAGFSFHDYCLAWSDSAPASCEAEDSLTFKNASDQAVKTGDALLMTEFGATDDVAHIQEMVDRADAAMIGWFWWDYCPCNNPVISASDAQAQAIVNDPVQPPTGDNLQTNKLMILSRPYPQAISGTPESYEFDASSGAFTLRYTTQRADGHRRHGQAPWPCAPP